MKSLWKMQLKKTGILIYHITQKSLSKISKHHNHISINQQQTLTITKQSSFSFNTLLSSRSAPQNNLASTPVSDVPKITEQCCQCNGLSGFKCSNLPVLSIVIFGVATQMHYCVVHLPTCSRFAIL